MRRIWLQACGVSMFLGSVALAQLPTTDQRSFGQDTGIPSDLGLDADGADDVPTGVPGGMPTEAAPGADPTKPITPDARSLAAEIAAKDAARESAGAAPPRPKPQLNGFQRFVKRNTARTVPMYGATYFVDPPTTFAQLKDAPVPGDYVIGPGDEIVARLTGVVDLNLRLTVDRTGRVTLPKVGAVSVAGVRVAELEPFLTRELGKSFRNFSLSATLGSLRPLDVYVVGEARLPGKYTVSSLTSFVNALFATGGPNGNGSVRRVQLIREGAVVAEIDLYEFISAGHTNGDVPLLPGDTLLYPVARSRVALLGDVHTEAVFELKSPEESLGDLLKLAGGIPVTATQRRATLERIDPHERMARTVVTLALDDAGLQTPLRDGDIATLFPISPAFSNAVTLRGNVAVPGRYAFREGMRIRDLIPDRESLMTNDYFRRKNAVVKLEMETSRSDIKELIDQVNWDYAVVERVNPPALATELIPFNLGKAVLEGDEAENLQLKPGDVVTVFGERDLTSPQAKRTRLARVEGEVRAPGIYQLAAGETLMSLIKRAGGFTDQAYIFGLALRRESVRQSQIRTLTTVIAQIEKRMNEGFALRAANLAGAQGEASQAQLELEQTLAQKRIEKLAALEPEGRVSLELDPAAPELPTVVLENEDRILVPARPSFVSVVGAVQNENSLLWKPGRTTAQYLEIAGPLAIADLGEIFVLRADGTVQSRGDGFWAWFGNRANGLILEPGDVIIVPERIDLETGYTMLVRGLKDWTQILANMGLAAATINVFR